MTPNKPPNKPLDARLAYRLVYPLRHSGIRPNHLTTLRLGLGLAAALLLAEGSWLLANLGAACFVLSFFLDHADGELARLTGKMSTFGHRYDLSCDVAINALLFIGIGMGLMRSGMEHALALGLLTGLSVALAVIYHSRLHELTAACDATVANKGEHVETEDILYLFPVLTWFDQLPLLLLAAAIGAPAFAAWVLIRYAGLKRAQER